ncbi:MAG: vWA domain-containing protein [Bacillota bacterium]
MRKYLLKIAVLIICTVTAPLIAFPYSGSARAESAAADNLAIVLLIDISGSMRYTDPEKLRETAAFLFIDLLNTADYLSVITFNQDVEIVTPLREIGSASQKALLKDQISAHLEPRGDTDYRAALQAAYDQLESAAAAGLRPVVILLTDGEPNPDTRYRQDRVFMEAYLEAMWETITRFTLSNCPVFTIAFSNEVDPAVIERISILTRGEHFLLDNPRELLLAFYELLETIKNRQRVIESSFALQGSVQTFPFTVSRQAVQANLIIENREGTDFSISVQPPGGLAGQTGNPAVSRGPGYCLVVFHEPGKSLQGEWQVSVSGRGSFHVLGNADHAIKAWIVEPAAGAMLPSGEPVPVRVRLTGVAAGMAQPIEVLVRFAGADGIRTERFPLVGDGEFYSGLCTGLGRPGIYEVQATVLLDSEPVAETASRVHLKNIPQLVAHSSLQECYRYGEEVALEASLQLGGQRLIEGAALALEYFQFVLSYQDGTRVAFPLHDSGAPGHGDLRVSDGIWSNRFVFDREGEVEAGLLAVGRYNGEDFILEKNLGPVAVHNPGAISLRLDRTDLYGTPGWMMLVPVTIENRSAFAEVLHINGPADGSFRVLESGFTLAPGEIKSLNLRVAVSPSRVAGFEALALTFSAGTALTVIEADSFNPNVEIVSRPRYLWRRVTAADLLPAPFKLFLLAGMLFYGGGLLLYRLFVYPRSRLGQLVFWKDGPRAGQTDSWGKFALSKARGEKAVVSFSSAGEADFTIEGSAYSYDLVFGLEQTAVGPLFLQGWLASRPSSASVKKLVASTPPGVIEVGGAVYTSRELRHGDEFQSGGYYFKYLEPAGRSPRQKESGVNILEGKV